MKKILLLSAVLVASALQCNAQTITKYLVDLAETQANAYNGDALTDFGISGPVTFVGGNNPAASYGGDTFTLGSATLTYASPSYISPSASATRAEPFRLTGGYAFNFGVAGSGTFTLSGLSLGDTINIQAIGTALSTDREGILTVTNGATNLGSATILSATGLGGTGTFTQVSNFVADGVSSYSLNFDRAPMQAEADFSGLLISVTPVPEPSTWLLGGLGMVILVAPRLLRKLKA